MLKNSQSLFYFILLVTLAVKLYIAHLVPITGDEAEYIMWGQHLALGYYDHPPMIGWVMHLTNMLGNSNIALRSPQIIMSSVFALVMVKILKMWDKDKAHFIACAYLVSPVSILDQGILTDTVLMWWVFLGVVFVFFYILFGSSMRDKNFVIPSLTRNLNQDADNLMKEIPDQVRDDSTQVRDGKTQIQNKNPKTQQNKQHPLLWCVFAGASFGCAYLSKFLLLPAALGVFLYFVFNRNIPKRFLALGIIIVCAAPFFCFNLWWNYHYDWVNYAFNLGLRNQAMHFGLKHFWIYLITVIYVYSPMLVYFFAKGLFSCHPRWAKDPGSSTPKTDKHAGLFIALTVTTVLFYLPLSFFKSIGLHWLFCTYPFAFMALITLCNTKQCKKLFTFVSIYTGAQVIVAIIILHIPMSFIQKHFNADKYEKANFFMNYAKLVPVIKPYVHKGYIIATASYSDSYLLTYKNHWTAAVWGVGTDNGRYDDFLSNFKTFNHKNMVVVDTQIRLRDKTFAPYFKHYVKKPINLNGSKMLLWVGYDFNYPLYKNTILRKIYHQYYTLPKWLPRSRHWFGEKYGFR